MLLTCYGNGIVFYGTCAILKLIICNAARRHHHYHLHHCHKIPDSHATRKSQESTQFNTRTCPSSGELDSACAPLLKRTCTCCWLVCGRLCSTTVYLQIIYLYIVLLHRGVVCWDTMAWTSSGYEKILVLINDMR